MKHISTIAIVAITALLVLNWTNNSQAEDKLGQPAAELDVAHWIKGDKVKVAGGGDKVYVVEFWATWCPPCRTSIPHLTKIQQDYKDKVVVIGVTNEGQEKVQSFVDKMGDKMDYTVVIDAGKTSQEYMKKFNQRGIPHAFIVDREGNIVWHGHPMGGLDKALEKVVKKDFDAAAFTTEQSQEAAKAEQLQKDVNAFRVALERGDAVSAHRLGREALAKHTDQPTFLNEISWQIMTDERFKTRDIQLAHQLAVAAVKVAEKADQAMILDTLARAQFELGHIDQAIETQEKALATCEDHEMKAELQAAMDNYQSAKEQDGALVD